MVTTMMAMQQNVQKQQLQSSAQGAQFVRANNMMQATNPAQQFMVSQSSAGQPLMFMSGSLFAVPHQTPPSSRSRTPSLQNQNTSPNVTQASKDNHPQALRPATTS